MSASCLAFRASYMITVFSRVSLVTGKLLINTINTQTTSVQFIVEEVFNNNLAHILPFFFFKAFSDHLDDYYLNKCLSDHLSLNEVTQLCSCLWPCTDESPGICKIMNQVAVATFLGRITVPSESLTFSQPAVVGLLEHVSLSVCLGSSSWLNNQS